jgi:hypothetical protein
MGASKKALRCFFDISTHQEEREEEEESPQDAPSFAGPHYKRSISKEGYCTLTPADYIPYFQKQNVGLVVRLNKKCYDEKVISVFEKVPPNKAFAVHCKAGLGRTGTCVGAYLMKHYKFTAAEVIGWMRICRPGMVIGPQQHFLVEIEQRMWHEGDAMKITPRNDISFVCISPDDSEKQYSNKKGNEKSRSLALGSLRFGALSVDERMKSTSSGDLTGRPGQGGGLLARCGKFKKHDPVDTMEF